MKFFQLTIPTFLILFFLCFQVCYADISTSFSITFPEISPLQIRYFATFDLTSSSSSSFFNFTHLLLMHHGSDSNAEGYWQNGNLAVKNEFPSGNSSWFIIAPRLADLSVVTPLQNEIYWNETSWKSGDYSTIYLPKRISSFKVLDNLLLKILERAPNIKDIVLAGHSGGGQILGRYALASYLNFTALGVHIRFLVGNPSSYPYLTSARPTVPPISDYDCRPFVIPPYNFTKYCSYNAFGYGFAKWSQKAYVQNITIEQAINQFEQRDVVYMLGLNDTCNEILTNYTCDSSGLDLGCSGMQQGRWRLERGRCYCQSVELYFGPNGDGKGHGTHSCGPHYSVEVPNCGHSSYRLFISQLGRNEIFWNRRQYHPHNNNQGGSSTTKESQNTNNSNSFSSVFPFLLFVLTLHTLNN